jgi:hypothetical protein
MKANVIVEDHVLFTFGNHWVNFEIKSVAEPLPPFAPNLQSSVSLSKDTK